MVLHTEFQKQPFIVFRHAAVQNIFGNTGGRFLMLVMTACENFALNWIFSVYSLSQLISLQIKTADW